VKAVRVCLRRMRISSFGSVNTYMIVVDVGAVKNTHLKG